MVWEGCNISWDIPQPQSICTSCIYICTQAPLASKSFVSSKFFCSVFVFDAARGAKPAQGENWSQVTPHVSQSSHIYRPSGSQTIDYQISKRAASLEHWQLLSLPLIHRHCTEAQCEAAGWWCNRACSRLSVVCDSAHTIGCQVTLQGIHHDVELPGTQLPRRSTSGIFAGPSRSICLQNLHQAAIRQHCRSCQVHRLDHWNLSKLGSGKVYDRERTQCVDMSCNTYTLQYQQWQSFRQCLSTFTTFALSGSKESKVKYLSTTSESLTVSFV